MHRIGDDLAGDYLLVSSLANHESRAYLTTTNTPDTAADGEPGETSFREFCPAA